MGGDIKIAKLTLKQGRRLNYLYKKTKQRNAEEKFKSGEYEELMKLIKKKLKGGKK